MNKPNKEQAIWKKEQVSAQVGIEVKESMGERKNLLALGYNLLVTNLWLQGIVLCSYASEFIAEDSLLYW